VHGRIKKGKNKHFKKGTLTPSTSIMAWLGLALYGKIYTMYDYVKLDSVGLHALVLRMDAQIYRYV